MKKTFSFLLVFLFLFSLSTATAEDYGIWQTKQYVDEFDMPTGNAYAVSELLTGTFSNSVTSNSNLNAYVFCDYNNYVWIRLFEYGNHRVTNPYSKSQSYTVSVMAGDGSKYAFNGVMYSGGGDIYIDTTTYDDELSDILPHNKRLISILMDGGNIRFSIKINNSTMSKYSFAINDASGFHELYQQLHPNRDEIIVNKFALITSPTHGVGFVKRADKITKDGKQIGTMASIVFDDGHTGMYAIPEQVNDGTITVKVP